MNITQMISEVTYTMPEDSDTRYRCFNTGGVEVEVGEFLYGFMRMIKPHSILETGTHKGISSSYMAGALKENAELGAQGQLTTIEFIEENFADSGQLFRQLGLDLFIQQHFGKSLEYNPGEAQFDFIFLDTEPEIRFAELIKFYKNLKEGGYVMIHDLHPHMHQIDNPEHGFGWPYGPLPSQIQDMVDKKELVPFHFRTPRGLTGFYKPGKEDYFYAV